MRNYKLFTNNGYGMKSNVRQILDLDNTWINALKSLIATVVVFGIALVPIYCLSWAYWYGCMHFMHGARLFNSFI